MGVFLINKQLNPTMTRWQKVTWHLNVWKVRFLSIYWRNPMGRAKTWIRIRFTNIAWKVLKEELDLMGLFVKIHAQDRRSAIERANYLQGTISDVIRRLEDSQSKDHKLVDALEQYRSELRANKQFEASDKLRDILLEAGYDQSDKTVDNE